MNGKEISALHKAWHDGGSIMIETFSGVIAYGKIEWACGETVTLKDRFSGALTEYWLEEVAVLAHLGRTATQTPSWEVRIPEEAYL
jgi:hypothetical protein